LIALMPLISTPVFSLFNSARSKSDFKLACLWYSFTSSRLVISLSNSLIIGCSGATTIYVAPNNVSGLVVYTTNSLSWFASLNLTSAPSLRPIQFLCCALILSK